MVGGCLNFETEAPESQCEISRLPPIAEVAEVLKLFLHCTSTAACGALLSPAWLHKGLFLPSELSVCVCGACISCAFTFTCD